VILMPYYIRLFSQSAETVPLDQLRASLASDLSLTVKSGSDASWNALVVASEDGRDVCMIERRVRGHDELTAAEIEDFVEAQQDIEPQSAAAWVKSYLKSCQSIYVCQFCNAAFENDLGNVPSDVMWSIRSAVGGIGHADGEGFNNQAGYHATWEFSNNATGPWKMAVLIDTDKWQHFEMDLGDASHRAAFRAGRVPDGVEIE
jgi:hypothetical protein